MNVSTAASLGTLDWEGQDLGGHPPWPGQAPAAADDACWRAPADFPGPLLHLAWGAKPPTLPSSPEGPRLGWTYTLVETGSPALVHAGVTERIAAPALVLTGPRHDFFWEPARLGRCKFSTWMWRRPVHPDFLPLDSGAFLHYVLDSGKLAELRQLHFLSRSEIHRGDTHSETALGGLQALIETCIVRSGEGSLGDHSKEIMDWSMHWIRLHLATRQPLARLADYLGVSPATVQRVFRKHSGSTVMKTIAEMRRQEAERMLARKGVTVKEVAYHLGYRHPHDFSRAFRKHSGNLPSRLGASCGRG